ncbi:hypothetical protein LQZ21_05645 [Treponema sp. TIM-1]|uniref:hypothetical protein n=1 Tax=Treponema sp. TIM-1 TaxID=2898417 RepID=UPI00397F9469
MSRQNIGESTGHPTFEDVWVMFQETDRKFQETDRKFQETDRKFQETDRKIKEASRIVGDLGNKLGIVVEHLVLANIKEKFNRLGYAFTKMGPGVLIEDPDKKIITEIDALLENGEYVLAIEVKTQLRIDHVDEHLERMEKLRSYADDRRDSRKFLGAVAGAVVAENVKKYAQKKGFYVIQQSGDTVIIENPPDFKPREW